MVTSREIIVKNGVIFMSTIQIMQVKDLEEVSGFLAQCFMENPLYVSIIPNTEHRLRFLQGFLPVRLQYAMSKGVVDIASDKMGIAAWLPSNASMDDNVKAMFFVRMKELGENGIEKMSGFVQFSAALEHELAPEFHWHLAPIAVASECRGKGYARRLLEYRLAQFDRDNMCCYLETQTLENVSIYRNFGFELVLSTEVPNINIPHNCMLRHPNVERRNVP
jgi:ribosomal protein S18 acetylase RimI-like enzyme